MNASQRPADGDTRPWPQDRSTLVITSRYPALAVGMALQRSGSQVGDRIRYEREWVCRHGGCDYRELVGDADAEIRETKNR